MSRDLALFDFDGTLTRGDSMLPFLRAAIGPVALTRALAATSPWLVGYAAGLIRNDSAKERLLAASLGGRSIDDLRTKGDAFARDDVPKLLRETMMAEFRRRRDEGRICVLVSASLDLYLEPWAREAGFAHVISSRLAVDQTRSRHRRAIWAAIATGRKRSCGFATGCPRWAKPAIASPMATRQATRRCSRWPMRASGSARTAGSRRIESFKAPSCPPAPLACRCSRTS